MPSEFITLYHATRARFESFDLKQTVDGGLHAGSLAQAQMRGGSHARIMAFDVRLENVRRCRDQGGHWADRIKAARRAGCDGIVYLNRYEGVPQSRLDALLAEGVSLGDMDRWPDAVFRKRVPEAQDSYIILHIEDLYQVRWLQADGTPLATDTAPSVDANPKVIWEPPRAALGQVVHVGTLNVQDKGVRGPSHEGHGLSFSVHPEVWERIADLGSQPHWVASAQAWRLLDGHACLKDEVGRDLILGWAQEHDWIAPQKSYEMHYWDDELQRLLMIPCATVDEAVEEYESVANEDDHDPRTRIVEVVAWSPTAKMCERLAQPLSYVHRPHALAEQWALTLWAQAHDWDGVWWSDALDPPRHSAPRGVLFPSAVEAKDWSPRPSSTPRSRARRVP